MGKDSKISWTNHTFNPYWGCTKIAAGCKHCYAETLANRFGLAWGGQNLRLFGDKHWRDPLKWDREAKASGARARVFCGSMCDVGELREGKAGEAMDEARRRLWKLIEATPNLDWLLLTKRPYNLGQVLPWKEPRENVWVGATVCTQADADKNIPELLQIPAEVRFLSCEPLLEELDLSEWIEYLDHCDACQAENQMQDDDRCPKCGKEGTLTSTVGYAEAERYRNHERWNPDNPAGVADVDGKNPMIRWCIVGGESGPHARPCRVEWIRSLVRQCREDGVPAWVKQLGTEAGFGYLDRVGQRTFDETYSRRCGFWPPDPEGEEHAWILRMKDRAGADLAEWPEDLRVREMPADQQKG